MTLGKVCGAIHSTINHPFYDHRRLLLVNMIELDGNYTDKYLIAVDFVDAGMGETVLIINEGNSSRQIVNDTMAPIRSSIIGIVDHITFK
jgi:ethanolamine utilization protein EutN